MNVGDALKTCFRLSFSEFVGLVFNLSVTEIPSHQNCYADYGTTAMPFNKPILLAVTPIQIPEPDKRILFYTSKI